jgi:hypothetical protein
VYCMQGSKTIGNRRDSLSIVRNCGPFVRSSEIVRGQRISRAESHFFYLGNCRTIESNRFTSRLTAGGGPAGLACC